MVFLEILFKFWWVTRGVKGFEMLVIKSDKGKGGVG